MKWLILVFFTAGIQMSALADAPPQDLNDRNWPQGSYQLMRRECVSGQPVRDNFIVGRDEWKLIFTTGAEFFSKTRWNGCLGVIFGNFEVRDEYLVFKNNSGADCLKPIQFSENFTFLFSNQGDQIVLTAFNGERGACRNDYLRSTFHKIQ